MTHTYLLEIGLEEMPAKVIDSASQQFRNKTSQFLKEQRLDFTTVLIYSTPRRLAVKIEGLSAKQADYTETLRGPSKKAALTDAGEWSKAAIGFSKGNKVDLDALYFKEVKGNDYVFVDKYSKGRPVTEILPQLIEVVKSLEFPVKMKWANYSFAFIRPVHWIVSLLDELVVPTSLFEVKADRITSGHRFLGKEIVLDHASDYEGKLKQEYVIADREERKQQIKTQVNKLGEEHDWKIDLDPMLLNEVTDMVEFPTAFFGQFNHEFLAVPAEALISSMKDHQRYFAVKNETDTLIPYFIGVRNGNAEHIDRVRKGNEKVLKARLSDAKFFYDEDRKHSIETFVDKLKGVSYHEKLGSLKAKMDRVNQIATILMENITITNESKNYVNQASAIYKFDLVTHMVGEFPELQGIMGEKYAVLEGYPEPVAQAIREHYLPLSSNGEIPVSIEGTILSLADKLDSLLLFFAADMIPTGSNDPFALRRQANGIVQIILSNQFDLPIDQLIHTIATTIQLEDADLKKQVETIYPQVSEFIKGRMKTQLQANAISYDIIEAILASKQEKLSRILETANLLQKESQSEDFRSLVEAMTRVINISIKNEETMDTAGAINPDLLTTTSEKALYERLINLTTVLTNDTAVPVYYNQLKSLQPLIDQFFEETMVMDKDETIRSNRLQLVHQVQHLITHFAQFDKLIVK
ncbi:glycine--tRNA ligase subunit beta [Lacticigenium naphthae]|uniref:glycine--tRNA ligase subunit beta n=1 Tax=Lacticigenium naphthae TaxID=515351 RepID=UPI0003F9FA34|nr:glycine--tRNA ligase subunit beta [Lacticigenium naphthae]